jgi:hypothetical protein
MKNKLIIFAVVALVWAHIAPQILQIVESGRIAEEMGCSRVFTFYTSSLDVGIKIHCSQYNSYDELINK